MSRRLINNILFALCILFSGAVVYAQDGAYSGYTPYSIYGIGDLQKPGTAFNAGMGGVGVATRNRRFINTMNPASVTARDTLSFMADFGLSGQTASFRQNDLKSANNTFNISNFVMSFPVYKSFAMMVGISPYTNVGYDYSYIETDPDIVGNTGNLGYAATGDGSIYQMYLAGGFTLWDRLSIGAEAVSYFGNIDKTVNLIFAQSSYRSVASGYVLQLKGTTGKFGLQYEQPVGNVTVTAGATYKLSSAMRGYVTDYTYASLSSQTDTLKHRVDTLGKGGLKFGDELGLGIALRGGDKWRFEINYLRSDWSGSGFDANAGFANKGDVTFSSSVSQSLRAGFEITPNRSDIRYFYKRWTYRAGAYYDEAYYRFNGRTVTSYGLTLGMTIPVYMGYNGISVGLDMGQRGNVRDDMVRERYIGFNVGVNIFDIWFRKHRYE